MRDAGPVTASHAGVVRHMLNMYGPHYVWTNEPLPSDGTVYNLIERYWPTATADGNFASVFSVRFWAEVGMR